MNSSNESPDESHDAASVDPIDQDAAHIDARSENAPQQIERLIEHVEDVGREASQRVDSDADGTEASA